MSARAQKRLMNDFIELQRNNLPCIAAEPLPDNIFLWHVNIKPDDGPFAGSVFHFRLHFPLNYPGAPPRVELLSSSMRGHPNVFQWGDITNGSHSNYICLSMLKVCVKTHIKE